MYTDASYFVATDLYFPWVSLVPSKKFSGISLKNWSGRGPLSPVRIIVELLERKVAAPV
jgi:hypothetical protein